MVKEIIDSNFNHITPIHCFVISINRFQVYVRVQIRFGNKCYKEYNKHETTRIYIEKKIPVVEKEILTKHEKMKKKMNRGIKTTSVPNGNVVLIFEVLNLLYHHSQHYQFLLLLHHLHIPLHVLRHLFSVDAHQFSFYSSLLAGVFPILHY